MKNIKKVNCYQLSLVTLLFGMAFLFQNCQDDLTFLKENQISTKSNLKSDNEKVSICHYSKTTDMWELITISKNAVLDHYEHHLDVFIDKDGDGFAAFNECGYLNENGIDCDDNNSAVNPGIKEICGDGIDNDCNGQIDDCAPKTYVPDDNFEQALIEKGYDDVLDNYVLTGNINTVSFLNVTSRNISDLTGIEDFTKLGNLMCNNNQLTSLDLSANIVLYRLYCYENKLTSLNISTNTALGDLFCRTNQLTSLDVSNCTALTSLICNENKLTSLDISKNTALQTLYCDVNQLTSIELSNNIALQTLNVGRNQILSIDVSNNTNLTSFTCSVNKLTNIDISKNISLKDFSCGTNQFTSIDVSTNISLQNLHIGNNQIASIDISNNPALILFACSQNLLTKLDVSANDLLSTLNCIYNPYLSCIQVNNTQLSSIPTNWKKDATASYSINCNY